VILAVANGNFLVHESNADSLAETPKRQPGTDAAKTSGVLALKLRDAPTNAEIERLARDNPGYRFERDPDGMLVVSPTGSNSGLRNSRLNAELFAWNEGLAQPGFCFDSSTGFTLPDESLISPEAAWIAYERWGMLADDEREAYARMSPTSSSKSFRRLTVRPSFARSSNALAYSGRATCCCSTRTATNDGATECRLRGCN
jgi:hypothetical protein